MNLCTFVKGTRYSCKDVTRCAEPEFAVCQNMFWDSAGHLLLASEVSYGAHVNYLTCWEARGLIIGWPILRKFAIQYTQTLIRFCRV